MTLRCVPVETPDDVMVQREFDGFAAVILWNGHSAESQTKAQALVDALAAENAPPPPADIAEALELAKLNKQMQARGIDPRQLTIDPVAFLKLRDALLKSWGRE